MRLPSKPQQGENETGEGRNTPTFLSFHPLTSCCCLPPARTKGKPEGARVGPFRLRRGVSHAQRGRGEGGTASTSPHLAFLSLAESFCTSATVFNQHSQSTYYTPGTALSSGYSSEPTDKSPPLWIFRPNIQVYVSAAQNPSSKGGRPRLL